MDHLLSQHSLQAAPADEQLHAIINIDRHFAPDASRDGCMRVPPAAGSSGAAAAAQERWHLQGLQLVPWDWSAKLRVRLSSAAAFAVLEEQRTSGLGAVCDALAAGGRCKEAAGLSNQERLCGALLQYQHPAAQLSTACMAALRGGEDGSLEARVSTWRQALRSAYSSLRHDQCPVLYISGQAFRQQFTAVLCAPSIMGCQQRHALVGRTNKLMRQHLAAYGCTGQLAGLLEQQQQQAQGKQLGATAFDGQPGSQLLVTGAQQVHGLYAALLALPWCGAEQPDVPQLLAPTQFLHAVVCPLRLEVLPDAVLDQQQQRQQQDAAAAVPGVQPMHHAELSAAGGKGLVTPWALHRLLQLLQDTQGQAGFDAYMDPEPSSSSLNLLQLTWQQARQAEIAAAAGVEPAAAAAAFLTGAAGAGGTAAQKQQQWQVQGQGLSEEEQKVWEPSRALLQGRVMRQLRVAAGGELTARLG
ncbi:hypothetical protein COO60DRAFT_196463 [Scenedesmus sp. NREL 46B-D3]|nr:hypothetical protein COO60DRAFT_196463 [Scenedesmus sp. NREL 46B-D3]